MSFSATVEQNYVSGGATTNTSTTYTNSARISVSESVADSVTDQLIALVLDVSEIKAVMLVATVAMTIEFNNSGAGVPTITLVANVPYIWTTDSYFTNLLTADITAMYATNASGGAGTVTFESIYDATP